MRKKIASLVALVALATLGATSLAQTGSARVQPNVASAATVKRQLVGTWQVLSIVLLDERGAVIGYPYGQHPAGKLTWTADGNMWAFLGTGVPAKAPRPVSVWYTGTFTIDVSHHLLVHRVQYSSVLTWEGTRLLRHYKFTAPRRLTITTLPSGPKGQITHVALRFRKLAP